jgi:hypothetical protein
MNINMPSIVLPYLKEFDETENLLLVITSYKIQEFMKKQIKRDFTSNVVAVEIYEIETPFIAKR